MNIHNDPHEAGFACRQGRSALRIVGLAVGGVVFAVFFAFLFGLLVKVLWNWLMPTLFGLGAISFWQAFGIVLLAKILFGGHGHGSKNDDRRHERHLRDKFKSFARAGGECGEKGPFPGNGARWRRFRQFWQEEGRAAFEAYLQKKENQESEKAENG